MKNTLIYLVLMTLAVWAGPAFADDDDQALEKQCKIKRARALSLAQKRVAGTVTDTDIDRDAGGKLYWSIDIQPAKGLEKEVHVDGQTGRILSVEDDDDDDD